ncbi:hypothetical protein CN97_00785 [Haematobacter massiliensis]|uniref:DUF2213 domain-containing protein n=1 Tax=Haematobacter massiliensis TaxID=195105 RepID=A0A086Y0E6_9RHOB|nr:hypothetical protein [Haematobacter massiliensis]KFI27746.1 hypothetical protein CN97_00785 [Haematobacter massiliensis]OWJ82719.1 hypothetical protein CDV51_17070 [Haematobacter massiliensis]
MKTVRVNIKATANTSAIRREKRGGRDKIIVPSATLPDGAVMNGIMYPAEEIEKGYATLDQTPAPLGHPTLDGQFVSASHTEAVIRNGIGAYNENVRRANGRVFLDKVIDVEFAGRTEPGKALLKAIENGEAIHTSTGLLLELENAPTGAGYKYIARNMFFDHDAILLDEAGAATPEQGVGMMVNKAADKDGNEIEVVNSALDEAERELDWAAEYAARAVDKLERAPLIERIKAAILEAVGVKPEKTGESATNQEMDMTVSKEQFDELSGEVKSLSKALSDQQAMLGTTIGEAVANAMKPLIDAQAAATNAQNAKDDEEKAALVEAVVNAGVMDKEAAEELSLDALRRQKTRTGNAAGMFAGNFKPNAAGAGFKAPEGD